MKSYVEAVGTCMMFGSDSVKLNPAMMFCSTCASAAMLADLSAGYLPFTAIVSQQRESDRTGIVKRHGQTEPLKNTVKSALQAFRPWIEKWQKEKIAALSEKAAAESGRFGIRESLRTIKS